MTSHSSYQEAVSRFSDYLKVHGKHCTTERFRILKCIYNQTSHFNAHQLYTSLEGESFHVSMATIYNTLEVLCECGLLRRHRFDNVNSEYELAKSSHIHLICNGCGKVREMEGSGQQPLPDGPGTAGFVPAYYTTYVYGLCGECRAKTEKINKDIKNII